MRLQDRERWFTWRNRWRQEVERGGEKGGKEGFGKCFSTVHHLSPHRQQLCQLNAPWHRLKKREVKSLRSVIKTPPILTWAEKKYLRTKGVDPQTTSFPPIAYLCQPVFPEKKNVVSFGKHHQSRLGWAMKRCCLSQRRCTMGHSSSLALRQVLSD